MFKPLAISLAIAAAFPAFPTLAHAEDDMLRVNVTGSNIRVSEKEGASAVQVITAKELKASGKTSVSDVLRAISANSGNSYNEQYTGSFSAGTSGLSLRGIGQKNTLILVNGKRVASYATAQNLQETFVDLNSLPMAAVQRIEVLKDGASSVYGSDAVAGVVNIILYKEFTGTDITAQWGGSTEGTGQHEKSAALQTGFGKLEEDGYSLVFSIDAQQRDKLQQSDVAWMRDADFRNQQRGSLGWAITNYAGTDPTRTLGGVRGPLQLVNYGDITPGKTGQVLAYNPSPYKTLIPGIQRVHTAARATVKLNADTEAYVDLLHSYSRADQTFSAPLTVNNATRVWNNATQALDTIPVVLPVGHPNNPGTAPLPFTATLFDLGPRLKQDKVTFYRALAGVKGTLAGWDWDAAVGHSSSKLEETVQNFVNRYEFQKVLADGSYNFFDQSQNSEAVRNRLRLSTLRPAESTLDTLDFSAAKDICGLARRPAGLCRRRTVAPRKDGFANLDGRAVGYGAAPGHQHHQRYAQRLGPVCRIQRTCSERPVRQPGGPRRPLQRFRQCIFAESQRPLPGGAVAAGARHRVARLPRAIAAGNHAKHGRQLCQRARSARPDHADADARRDGHYHRQYGAASRALE